MMLDPFETAVHKDNCVHGHQVEDTLETKIRERMSSTKQQLKGNKLAEMLAENDPFEVCHVMKNVSNIYKSSTTHIQENESNTGSQCVSGENCLGCSLCDGMEEFDAVEAEAGIDEEDEQFLPAVGDEVFCVDSDDEKQDLFEVNDDSAATVVEEYGESKSFWDHRMELALVLEAERKQKELFNSSCRSCHSPVHCSECNSKEFASAKKNANYIKEFAMRTPLMELGVCESDYLFD